MTDVGTKARREAVAAEVRTEMSQHGHTQRDVAAILGIPQSSVSLRMNGDRAFKAEELALLAEAWQIPVSRLFPPDVRSAS